jgi:hypothetical protein
MQPDLRVLQGTAPGPVRRRPMARISTDRLGLASDRLRRLEQLLRHSGRPAEAVAAGHIRDLVDAAVAADESRFGMA